MALRKLFKKGDDTEEVARLVKKADASSHLASPAHDESNWLVSYADMMTLLCGFFIMMFSMAKLDEPQYEKVKESVAKTFGGEYKSPTNELAKFVTNVLQEAGIEKEVTVRSGPGGVAMIFSSTLFFDTLSADVKPQGQVILNKLIESLATRQRSEGKNYKVVVEGHTDNRPIIGGGFPSNWELSGSRASRVIRMFLDRGFNPALLTSIGYADTRPAVKATQLPNGMWDENALAKNRRVVVRVLEPKMDSIPFPESGNLTETAEASPTHTAQPPRAVSAAPVAPATVTPTTVAPATPPAPAKK